MPDEARVSAPVFGSIGGFGLDLVWGMNGKSNGSPGFGLIDAHDDTTVVSSWASISPNPGLPFDLPFMPQTRSSPNPPIDPNTGALTLASSGIVNYYGQPFPNLGATFTLPRNYDDY